MKILANKFFINSYLFEIENLWKKDLKIDEIKEDFNDCDILIILNRMRLNKIMTNGFKILITWEPPNIRHYPRKYLEQFDLVISNFKVLNFEPSKFIYPSFIRNYNCISDINNKIDGVCILNSIKYKLELLFYRSILFNYLENNNIALLYGKGTKNGEKSKDILSKFKYTVIVENYKEDNHFVEKITDAILLETLPFYYGASKIFDNKFIHPMSVINININNLEETVNIIKKSIKNKEYEKRLKFIKLSKKNLINGSNNIPSILNNLTLEKKKEIKFILNDKKFIFERLRAKFYKYTISNFIFLFNLLYHIVLNLKFYFIVIFKKLLIYFILFVGRNTFFR